MTEATQLSDITSDVFAGTKFGMVALQKLAPLSVGFRFFKSEWLEAESKKPEDWTEMRLTGCQYGELNGCRDVPLPGTVRSVVVSRAEADQLVAASA